MGDAFEEACKYMQEHHSELTNEQKEYLYGAYKQSTQGDAPMNNGWTPMSVMKQNAWKKFKGTSKEDAKKQYVAYVNSIRSPV